MRGYRPHAATDKALAAVALSDGIYAIGGYNGKVII